MRPIDYRRGHGRPLAEKFLRRYDRQQLGYTAKKLDRPQELWDGNVLAVHFADGGAQGEGGAVKLLVRTEKGVEVLWGNYAYGDLDLNAVIRVLPMLKPLDSRYSPEPPYPFGGKLEVPAGWVYQYMGAMNHLFVRAPVATRARSFLQALTQDGAHQWKLFQAIAWFCRAR